jgi:small subunit ribosomal protein S2
MEKTKEILDKNSIEEPVAEEVVLTPSDEVRLKSMMENGLFYGLTKARTNPKMKPFIASAKAGVQIIDLLKTMEMLDKSVKFIKDKIKAGGLVLFVGVTPASKGIVKSTAEKLGMPYITERWLGGTLTNFKTISERINYMKRLKADKESGALEKYTKKERLELDRELVRLIKFFGGIELLEKLPSAVVIFDLKNSEIAANEARRMNIPAVAFLNTNANPDLADYPVPMNDKNIKSIEFIMSVIETAVVEAKKEKLAIEAATSVIVNK